jgi:hypothetical protein
MNDDSTWDPKVGDTMIVLRSSRSSPRLEPHRAKVIKITSSGLIDVEFSTTVGAQRVPRTLRFKAWKRRRWGPGRYAVDQHSRGSSGRSHWWTLAWPLPGELEAYDNEQKRVKLLGAVQRTIERYDDIPLDAVQRIAAILSIEEDKA